MASPRIHSPVDRQQEVDKLLFDLDKFFSNLQNAGNLIVEAAELGSSALRRFNGEAEKNGNSLPMDSVPYAFCEDVLERLSKENLDTMTELSGQWKTVVQRFIEKRRTFNITISKDSEGWFYGVEDATDETKTRKIEIDEHSHEEFLSMDRRYVEINQISIYSDLDQSDFEELDPDLPLFQCSSELRCTPLLDALKNSHLRGAFLY
ncbi:hypothetical protein QR680_010438 [Steinernema hermaphroditum]|uniref:F-box domain-containing protein n=1 Tax=Steinernema hermaphroditum TaxID=289476 RepID=A0AA39IQK0_9BILA|nr:hypothetical protein QR680_010438 [Steinernema hermaphroditum]